MAEVPGVDAFVNLSTAKAAAQSIREASDKG
jgi:hypothetical protein